MSYYRIVPSNWPAQAKRRRRQIERGLCINCKRPSWKGRRRCLRCLKVQRRCEAQRRALRNGGAS